jgi:hypothetical protein
MSLLLHDDIRHDNQSVEVCFLAPSCLIKTDKSPDSTSSATSGLTCACPKTVKSPTKISQDDISGFNTFVDTTGERGAVRLGAMRTFSLRRS